MLLQSFPRRDEDQEETKTRKKTALDKSDQREAMEQALSHGSGQCDQPDLAGARAVTPHAPVTIHLVLGPRLTVTLVRHRGIEYASRHDAPAGQ